MPYSAATFDKTVEAFIGKHKLKHYLDVGAGSGKYAKLIRSRIPTATIIGIESEAAYIRQFSLAKLYTKILRQRVERFIQEQPDFVTDIAIIGDCIEHLSKSAGVDLLHYLIYRTRYIIVIFPTAYIQYTWRKHRSEAHRSVWSEDDFSQFDYVFRKRTFMNMAIISGYCDAVGSVLSPGHSATKSKVKGRVRRDKGQRE